MRQVEGGWPTCCHAGIKGSTVFTKDSLAEIEGCLVDFQFSKADLLDSTTFYPQCLLV